MTQNKPKEKKYYSVKLEGQVPVELHFKVLAESPEEAAEIVSKNPLPPLARAPRPILPRLRRLKATVYRYGTTTIDYIKNFMG